MLGDLDLYPKTPSSRRISLNMNHSDTSFMSPSGVNHLKVFQEQTFTFKHILMYVQYILMQICKQQRQWLEMYLYF